MSKNLSKGNIISAKHWWCVVDISYERPPIWNTDGRIAIFTTKDNAKHFIDGLSDLNRSNSIVVEANIQFPDSTMKEIKIERLKL